MGRKNSFFMLFSQVSHVFIMQVNTNCCKLIFNYIQIVAGYIPLPCHLTSWDIITSSLQFCINASLRLMWIFKKKVDWQLNNPCLHCPFCIVSLRIPLALSPVTLNKQPIPIPKLYVQILIEFCILSGPDTVSSNPPGSSATAEPSC